MKDRETELDIESVSNKSPGIFQHLGNIIQYITGRNTRQKEEKKNKLDEESKNSRPEELIKIKHNIDAGHIEEAGDAVEYGGKEINPTGNFGRMSEKIKSKKDEKILGGTGSRNL